MAKQDQNVNHLSVVEPEVSSIDLIGRILTENGEQEQCPNARAEQLDPPGEASLCVECRGRKGVVHLPGELLSRGLSQGLRPCAEQVNACRLNGHACRFLS